MNHKLRVLVRVDADPGHVSLELTGCLTRADFPALTHLIRRARPLGTETDVSLDLHGASHLDPETLLQLRRIADAGTGPDGSGPLRVALLEPEVLPVCPWHVGADGEVLAGLEAGLAAAVPAGACSLIPHELDTFGGLEPAGYFEGTLDPAATVRALSDAALGQLADALYRQLDTSSPSFGTRTWYELATEELQHRQTGQAVGPAVGPAGGELAAGRPGLDALPAAARLAP